MTNEQLVMHILEELMKYGIVSEFTVYDARDIIENALSMKKVALDEDNGVDYIV